MSLRLLAPLALLVLPGSVLAQAADPSAWYQYQGNQAILSQQQQAWSYDSQLREQRGQIEQYRQQQQFEFDQQVRRFNERQEQQRIIDSTLPRDRAAARETPAERTLRQVQSLPPAPR